MTNSNEITSVELNIKQAKEHIEFGAALERLLANRDFKKVIGTGYFEQEAVRLVHLKGDVSMQSEASQVSIVKQMDAIAGLSQYFYTAGHRAMCATRGIASDEATLAELLQEEAE